MRSRRCQSLLSYRLSAFIIPGLRTIYTKDAIAVPPASASVISPYLHPKIQLPTRIFTRDRVEQE
uniref:hypothetical protein n=1 Tax=Trichocoleus desertorum TaxID=1481672 RepID=UPI0025B6258C|nr:hypothetical protein [Trichocoleus desertorum]